LADAADGRVMSFGFTINVGFMKRTAKLWLIVYCFGVSQVGRASAAETDPAVDAQAAIDAAAIEAKNAAAKQAAQVAAENAQEEADALGKTLPDAETSPEDREAEELLFTKETEDLKLKDAKIKEEAKKTGIDTDKPVEKKDADKSKEWTQVLYFKKDNSDKLGKTKTHILITKASNCEMKNDENDNAEDNILADLTLTARNVDQKKYKELLKLYNDCDQTSEKAKKDQERLTAAGKLNAESKQQKTKVANELEFVKAEKKHYSTCASTMKGILDEITKIPDTHPDVKISTLPKCGELLKSDLEGVTEDTAGSTNNIFWSKFDKVKEQLEQNVRNLDGLSTNLDATIANVQEVSDKIKAGGGGTEGAAAGSGSGAKAEDKGGNAGTDKTGGADAASTSGSSSSAFKSGFPWAGALITAGALLAGCSLLGCFDSNSSSSKSSAAASTSTKTTSSAAASSASVTAISSSSAAASSSSAVSSSSVSSTSSSFTLTSSSSSSATSSSVSSSSSYANFSSSTSSSTGTFVDSRSGSNSNSNTTQSSGDNSTFSIGAAAMENDNPFGMGGTGCASDEHFDNGACVKNR
jgi:hypothetical protein